MLLTYSITKAKRALCDVAQFVADSLCTSWGHNILLRTHSALLEATTFWPLWWRESLSIREQITLNHIRFFLFYQNIKDSEINISLDTENTDSDLKVHTLHYATELLIRVRLSFQKLLQTRLICRNNTKKNVWEASNDTYSLSVRVQTTVNLISICFLPQ